MTNFTVDSIVRALNGLGGMSIILATDSGVDNGAAFRVFVIL